MDTVQNKTNVLLVDDDTSLVGLIEMYFEDRYNLTIAEDAIEAFKHLQNKIPDIILLDVMMPKMNGLQLLKEIRKDDKFKTIPVILLTAKGTDQDAKIGLETGANRYITKPFDFDELFQVIETCLHQQSATV